MEVTGSATGTGTADQGGAMTSGVGVDAEADTIGKAGAGGTAEALPAVRVSRAVSAPVTHVWEVLVSSAGAQALLGPGAELGTKGEPYHCEDGTRGVLRSYHPLEQLRVSWHATPDAPPSVVEVDLRRDGDQTLLDLSQTHLPEGSDVQALSTRWSRHLDELAACVER